MMGAPRMVDVQSVLMKPVAVLQEDELIGLVWRSVACGAVIGFLIGLACGLSSLLL